MKAGPEEEAADCAKSALSFFLPLIKQAMKLPVVTMAPPVNSASEFRCVKQPGAPCRCGQVKDVPLWQPVPCSARRMDNRGHINPAVWSAAVSACDRLNKLSPDLFLVFISP